MRIPSSFGPITLGPSGGGLDARTQHIAPGVSDLPTDLPRISLLVGCERVRAGARSRVRVFVSGRDCDCVLSVAANCLDDTVTGVCLWYWYCLILGLFLAGAVICWCCCLLRLLLAGTAALRALVSYCELSCFF